MTALLLIVGLVIVVVAALTGQSIADVAASSVSFGPTDGDNVTQPEAPSLPQHIDAAVPATWPSGNRVWDVCRAVAFAEGYQVPGSVPARLNNPGDISDGRATYGSEFHSGSNITTFPNAATGWSWLYTKVDNVANGRSSVYDPSMSWREIGAKWAPQNAEVWASNVAGALGVDSDSSLGDYMSLDV